MAATYKINKRPRDDLSFEPDDDSNVVHSGYVQKESMYLKTMRSRWIILKNDNKLYSYKQREQSNIAKPTEIIDLTECSEVKHDTTTTNQFSFVLVLSNGKQRRFTTTTQRDLREWMQCINGCLDHSINPENHDQVVAEQRHDSGDSKENTLSVPSTNHNNNAALMIRDDDHDENDDSKEDDNNLVAGSLSDDEDEDESTVLTDTQWKQLRSDGFCILDDPLKHELAVNVVSGYIRSNFASKYMIDELIRLIIIYYHTRYNTELYVELSCPNQGVESFLVPRQNLRLSGLLQTRLDMLCHRIEVTQVPTATMRDVLRYLGRHRGVEPGPLPCPIRSIHMSQIVSDPWDASYVDAMDKKTVFETILAANYLDCKPLLHLGAAKIATLIKQLDQSEINRIIEEEEQYRRDQAARADQEDNEDEDD